MLLSVFVFVRRFRSIDFGDLQILQEEGFQLLWDQGLEMPPPHPLALEYHLSGLIGDAKAKERRLGRLEGRDRRHAHFFFSPPFPFEFCLELASRGREKRKNNSEKLVSLREFRLHASFFLASFTLSLFFIVAGEE